MARLSSFLWITGDANFLNIFLISRHNGWSASPNTCHVLFGRAWYAVHSITSRNTGGSKCLCWGWDVQWGAYGEECWEARYGIDLVRRGTQNSEKPWGTAFLTNKLVRPQDHYHVIVAQLLLLVHLSSLLCIHHNKLCTTIQYYSYDITSEETRPSPSTSSRMLSFD